MNSPCRAHKQRVIAAQSGAAEPEMDSKTATQHELMLMQLAEHRRSLKQIQSIERKIEVKRKLLPEYDAYVQGVLQGKSGRQDDVLMTILVWYIDTGAIEKALAVADYALQYGLQTPDRYERSTACLIAEEIADTALKLMEGENAISSALLSKVISITENHDMFDQVRARLLKAYGMSLTKSGDLEGAIEPLKRALELDERCGVKKLIEQTEREVKKNSVTPEVTPAETEEKAAEETPAS